MKKPLYNSYDGPYKVLRKSDKIFVIDINGQDTTVSFDRLKPTFVSTGDYLPTDRSEPLPVSTRSGRAVKKPVRFKASNPDV